MPAYWFYLAALVGALLAAALLLRKLTLARAIGFVVLCDVLVAWIGALALEIYWRPTMHLTAWPDTISAWATWLGFSLAFGVLFGNLVTLGFPALVGAVPLICTWGLERAIRRGAPR
jgi:hypothetical protein